MGTTVRDILLHLGFSSDENVQILQSDEIRDWLDRTIYDLNTVYDTDKPIFIKGNGYKVAGATFERLKKEAKLPRRNNPLDIGYDVCSINETTLYPGEQRVVSTGLRLAGVNKDLGILVWPKSGLDAMYGLHTGAGVIDSGYRGEIKVLLKNQGTDPITIKHGDEIAQLLFVPIARPIISVSIPTPTERGESGGINETP